MVSEATLSAFFMQGEQRYKDMSRLGRDYLKVGQIMEILRIKGVRLIEILTDVAYYMTDIQLLIGQSSSERERKKKERMRLKRQNLLPSGEVDICPPILEYRDKSIERVKARTPMAVTKMFFFVTRN